MPDVFSITLNLGKGDCSNGFPSISLNAQSDRSTFQCVGSLPAPIELLNLCQQWQQTYDALYDGFNLRRLQRRASQSISIDEDDITNISRDEFNLLCKRIGISINEWLNSSSFQALSRQLHFCLSPEIEARITITAEDARVYQLPWHLWDLLDIYPLIEISFSPPSFSSKSRQVDKREAQNRVLAIFGSSENLDVETDRLFIESLPNTDTSFFSQPSRKDFDNHLRDIEGWDILFFAGHSSSTRDLSAGVIEIAPSRFLSIADLKHSLVAAIRNDLQLAIFNSCDGLGLARELANLNIPQLIVMRASVPDEVAQEFLKHLLEGLSSGHSFYLAEREARERLQGLEDDYPCASWLPIVFQNPAAPTIHWKSLKVSNKRPPLNSPAQIALAALGATLLATVTGFLGWIEPLELKAYDWFMRLRPSMEEPDPRLLVVGITDADIEAQPISERMGQSISDRTLERLIDKLSSANARVIGLDLYRDIPVSPEYEILLSNWQSNDRLIGICKIPDSSGNPGIAPPPDIRGNADRTFPLSTRVGFSDVSYDPDGVIRRQLLGGSPRSSSSCQSDQSFSALVAQRFLIDDGIQLSSGAQRLGDLNLGAHLIGIDSGGYRPFRRNGFQLMLNFRTSRTVAETVTLSEILSDRFDIEKIENRIVLIGSLAETTQDRHLTPLSSNQLEKTHGVIIQAHSISQLLSAVLDDRPLIWWWPQWGRFFWIGSITFFFGLCLSQVDSKAKIAIVVSASILFTIGSSYILFLILGNWTPLIPTLVSMTVVGTFCIIISNSYEKYLRKSIAREANHAFSNPN